MDIQNYLDRVKDTESFLQIWSRVASIQSAVNSHECSLLYDLARFGPGEGFIVEIGSSYGRSTVVLSLASKLEQREKVVSVDHHNGDPCHGYAPTWDYFIGNLREYDVQDYVDVRRGESGEIEGTWVSPIRLLFIDGAHEYESVSRDYMLWSKHVISGGIILFHDYNIGRDGVTKFINELGQEIEFGTLNSLAVFISH